MSSIHRTTDHATQIDAEQAGQAYLEAYHPAGYGTTYSVYYSETRSTWVLYTYRYSSCD